MLAASLGKPGAPLTILCLGAHSDDIEIGAGGALLRLLSERPGSTVHWVVFTASAQREDEARASAQELLAGAGRSTVELHAFRDGFFPSLFPQIKDEFERLKRAVSPDLVFSHRTLDLHQDHRIIGELTWNTFRNHLILEYEIPKYEGDLGQPNVYVPLSKEAAALKVALILKHFASQTGRSWFRAATFESLLRLRAIECNAPEGFAEGFYARKVVI
jgi:LmbE family N-acetylglucosaminyl deacetylase